MRRVMFPLTVYTDSGNVVIRQTSDSGPAAAQILLTTDRARQLVDWIHETKERVLQTLVDKSSASLPKWVNLNDRESPDWLPVSVWATVGIVFVRQPSPGDGEPVDIYMFAGQALLAADWIKEAMEEIRPQSASTEQSEGKTAMKAEKSPHPTPRIPASAGEVIIYGLTIGLPEDEAEKFFDYYTAVGWQIGPNPVVSWKPLLRNWFRRWCEWNGHAGNAQSPGFGWLNGPDPTQPNHHTGGTPSDD